MRPLPLQVGQILLLEVKSRMEECLKLEPQLPVQPLAAFTCTAFGFFGLNFGPASSSLVKTDSSPSPATSFMETETGRPRIGLVADI